MATRFALSLGALALVLTGCTSTDQSVGDDVFYTEEMAPSLSVESTEESFLETEAAVRDDSALSREPDVITTGYLSLIVDDPSASADEISVLVVDSGGRVSSRSDYSPTDYGSPTSYVELRIPADALESTLEAIRGVGTVQDSSISQVDVSLQKVDLDARLAVLDAGLERLRALLEEAETTADVITIESAITDRVSERDSLAAQRDYLSDQTLFATVNVTLYTPADAAPRNQDGFLDGLIRGLESIVAFGVGIIVWAGILLPWAGLLAIVVALGVIIRKVRAREQ